MEKGYLRVYTGNGQGKTTAAFGVLVRALCAGTRGYVGQFIKDEAYNETFLSRHFKHLCIEQLGKGCFIDRKPDSLDKAAAQAALRHVTELMASGQYDIVVLDELTIAIHYNLVSTQAVLDALEQRCLSTEVIITGRYAPPELIAAADLVTEMKEIKHYYLQGVLSRDGFDH